MNKILYFAARPFIELIIHLPFSVIYRLSDLLKFILQHIVQYRKEIVFSNLKKSFPQLSDTEIGKINDAFYEWFTDLIVETLKSFSMKESDFVQRVSIKNIELLNKTIKENSRIIYLSSHSGNWEWSWQSIQLQCPGNLQVIYYPLKNEYFNNYLMILRKRFGVNFIEAKYVFDHFKNESTKDKEIILFGNDQSANPKYAFETFFLNQKTIVNTGAETLAKKYNIPVLCGFVRKIRRGYYEIEVRKIEFDYSSSDFLLTEKYSQLLEEFIQSQPFNWLWSHRRWKIKNVKTMK